MNDFQRQTLALAEQSPPGCLNGFRLRGETEITRRVVRDMYSHYENPPVAAFELHHDNGEEKGKLFGHYLDRDWPPDHGGGRILVSPLLIQWQPSGEMVSLIDCTRHGCSAELGHRRAHSRSENALLEWKCPKGECVDPVFVACFSYTPGVGESAPDEMRTRPQDFFDMFLLAAYSAVKQQTFFVTEFKCA